MNTSTLNAPPVEQSRHHPYQDMPAASLANFPSVKKQRAMTFLTTGMPEYTRKFGYWGSAGNPDLPTPKPEAGGRLEKGLFSTLVKEIQPYAGAVPSVNMFSCCVCHARNISQYEYVFHPRPEAFLYRWPDSLQHYHEAHNIAETIWLQDLVFEFRRARMNGFWLK